MKKLILGVVLVNLLAACSSNQPKEAISEPKPATAASIPAKPTVTAAQSDADVKTTAAKAKVAAAARVQDDHAVASTQVKAADQASLEKNSVFFPFDVDAVQDADKETILTHAGRLAQNSNLKVRIEGNADERGSSEYNLALGQRRAKNTRNALVFGGAKSSQIETVSYGEEKPRCTEHNESCWSQNRRADINYIAGK